MAKSLEPWRRAGRIWRKLTPEERAEHLNEEKPQYKPWSNVSTKKQKKFMESIKDADL